MTEENQDNTIVLIDREYVSKIVESNFDTKLTEEQWDEVQDRICENIYPAVCDAVGDMFQDSSIRSKKPYFRVMSTNDDIRPHFSEDAIFATEAEAQAHIEWLQRPKQYPPGVTPFKYEYKVEKVD